MIETVDQAERIYAEAREHHRLASHHRRRSRERMEELRRFCDAHRIAFEFITRKDGGEHRHGQEVEERST